MHSILTVFFFPLISTLCFSSKICRRKIKENHKDFYTSFQEFGCALQRFHEELDISSLLIRSRDSANFRSIFLGPEQKLLLKLSQKNLIRFKPDKNYSAMEFRNRDFYEELISKIRRPAEFQGLKPPGLRFRKELKNFKYLGLVKGMLKKFVDNKNFNDIDKRLVENFFVDSDDNAIQI